MIAVACHACSATTTLRSENRYDISRKLAERGWRNDRGVIACKAHAHIEVMPRHRRLARRAS